MSTLFGVDPAQIFDEEAFELGTVAQKAEREDVFVRFGADVLIGEVVRISRAFFATPLTTDLANVSLGSPVGVVNADASAGEYGFVLVRGLGEFYVGAGAEAKASLYASATPGVLTSMQGTNEHALTGIVSHQTAAVATRVAGELNNPLVGPLGGGDGGGMGSGLDLPTGTAARNRLGWDDARGNWEAIGDSSQIIVALTRTAATADFVAAIQHLLDNPGRAYPADRGDTGSALTFSVTDQFGRTFLHRDNRSQIANVWNDENSPIYCWVASPAPQNWIEGFYLQHNDFVPGSLGTRTIWPQDDFAITRDLLEINGEVFDVGKLQVQGDWPGPWRADMPQDDFHSMRVYWEPPKAPANTVNILDLTRYAVFLENDQAPPDLPTEAQWLAGNTSQSAIISAPGGGTGTTGRVAFAVPSHLPSLTIMQPEGGFLLDRTAFTPAVDEPDVLVTIAGVQKKAYVERRGGPGEDFDTEWTLR